MQLRPSFRVILMGWRISLPNNEFGDFQTPLALAEKIIRLFDSGTYDRILEPTCGTGSFLQAIRKFGAREAVGVEVQPHHVTAASAFARVIQANVFEMDLSSDLDWTSAAGPLLVVGNPPWVTSADLSRFGSANIPSKSNVKNLTGMEARTGSSNFDVAEFIWLKLIRELQGAEPTIALLCKTQVARNVIAFCAENRLPMDGASLYLIDSMRWFGAAVDAGLFIVKVRSAAENYVCELYADLDADRPLRSFGMVDGKMVSDVAGYVHTNNGDGSSHLEWRQGIKHDATQVMELIEDNGPRKKSGEPVHIEPSYLYPLLKSTDIFRARTTVLSKWMVVPQRSLAESTTPLEVAAPQLWSYLGTHSAVLDGRKSSIYTRRPRFCIFGVGDYSFQPYKVAISGMHKEPRFRLVGPIAGKPAVFDDTCYFLPFVDAAEAAIVCAVLQSRAAMTLLESLVFWDSKRPVTKKLLQRLDLSALAAMEDPFQLVIVASELCAKAEISPIPDAADLRIGLEALINMSSCVGSPQLAYDT